MSIIILLNEKQKDANYNDKSNYNFFQLEINMIKT